MTAIKMENNLLESILDVLDCARSILKEAALTISAIILFALAFVALVVVVLCIGVLCMRLAAL